MSMKSASLTDSGLTTSAPPQSNVRWFVCGLLFLATMINYMDRSALALVEPLLHLPFMGMIPGAPVTTAARSTPSWSNTAASGPFALPRALPTPSVGSISSISHVSPRQLWPLPQSGQISAHRHLYRRYGRLHRGWMALRLPHEARA